MKRTLSVVLSLVLAVCLALSVSAEETAVLTTDAFDPTVRTSATDTYATGTGLGFCFTLNAANVAKNENNHAVKLDDATLTYQGEACPITAMGAVVTHVDAIATAERLTRDGAADNPLLVDVTAKKLYRATATYAMYAVRVVDIPLEMEDKMLYARPYVVVEQGGETVTLYGAIAGANYTDTLNATGVRTPGYGDDVDGNGRLFVGDTTVLCDTLYIEIQDELDEWMTIGEPLNKEIPLQEALKSVDHIRYACYDKDGNLLTDDDPMYGYILLPAMSSTYATTILEAPLAEGTAQVRIIGAEIIYWTEWEI